MYIQLPRFPSRHFASFALALGLTSGLGAIAQTNATVYFNGTSPAAACAEGTATSRGADRQLLDRCRVALETQALSRADRAATLVNLGTLESRAGRTDAAFSRFDEARRIEPDLPGIEVNIAAAQIRAGDYDGALGTLADPDAIPSGQRHIAHFNRGLALWHLGRFQDAYEAFTASEATQPGYAPARRMLGNFTVTPVSADTAPQTGAANG